MGFEIISKLHSYRVNSDGVSSRRCKNATPHYMNPLTIVDFGITMWDSIKSFPLCTMLITCRNTVHLIQPRRLVLEVINPSYLVMSMSQTNIGTLKKSSLSIPVIFSRFIMISTLLLHWPEFITADINMFIGSYSNIFVSLHHPNITFLFQSLIFHTTLLSYYTVVIVLAWPKMPYGIFILRYFGINVKHKTNYI